VVERKEIASAAQTSAGEIHFFDVRTWAAGILMVLWVYGYKKNDL
jgi:hypothetical protein